MKNMEYALIKVSEITGIGIGIYETGQFREICSAGENNPLYCSEKLRVLLAERADRQDVPVIYEDEYGVCFGCIKWDTGYVVTGPIAIKRLNHVELHQFSIKYHIGQNQEEQMHRFTTAQVLAVTAMLGYIVTGREIAESELMDKNRIRCESQEDAARAQIQFSIKEDEEERYHHTYMEERRLLDCIREGKVEEAVRNSMGIDRTMGKLSENEIHHWRNTVAVAITLCTRAAIEAGVSPVVAYRLSDYYIQKNEECKDIPAMIDCRNRAVRDLTERVKQKLEGKTSSYVEQCKNYVDKHYKEKIYLDDIAETLGISSTYLSRVFSKETGMRFQDYVTSVRVERAANLLMYSDENLAHIAEYVNFPSQSYFGNVFKKYKGMTPREFRERYKPKDFI